ncbi:MAG: hypothetical protein ABJB74_04805 [Gemmatimonas sp.]
MVAATVARAQTAAQSPNTPARVLDTFETREGWGSFPSDGVKLSLLMSGGVSGNAMTLAYNFDGRAGYAIARKAFPIGTPAGNWSFSFKARGSMRPNTLEFKLLDKSGENVWWYTIPEYQPTGVFETIAIRQRQVTFAWGPIGGGPPRDIAAIEIVVTAGSGGDGTLTIDDLVFTPLPADVPVSRVARVTATYTSGGSKPEFAIDSDSTTIWRAKAPVTQARPAITPTLNELDATPTLTLDLGGVRTYGGLVVQWSPNQQPRYVVVDSSNNGTSWGEAGRLFDIQGARSYLPITDGSSRFIRLRLSGGAPADGQFGIRTLSVRPLEFAATPTALLHSIAADSPRGEFPRALHDEQVYWSVIGVNGGASEALLSEDGQLELAKRGPSLEPFLRLHNKLITWADVTPTQSLLDSVRPMPSVKWKTNGATMTVTAFVAGTVANSSTYARYRIVNTSRVAMSGTFALALRPIQVNPPWQFLNTPGGAARVDSLSWNGSTLSVNAGLRVQPLTMAVNVGVTTLDAGESVSWIRTNRVPPARRVVDERAMGSAVMSWPVNLAPGDSTDIVVASRLDGSGDPSLVGAGAATAVRAATTTRMKQVAAIWARDQDAVSIHLPKLAPPIAAAIKANLAWILINRDGPRIQPGSRSYERSWIRDGTLTAEALLRLGHSVEAKQFAEWYAPFQYPNGKIPCCVDARGADPVDEHDSHGEFIHLVYEVFKFSGDTAFAKRMWPHVKLAVQFMDTLRATHLTVAYQTDSLKAFRGLLPASISHEGYSAKPMHSVWDDGFALLGYQDALALATILNDSTSEPIARSLAVFSANFTAAITGAMRRKGISYIPGSIELLDFDATSTTTLLSPGHSNTVTRMAAKNTLDRYFRSSSQRTRPDSIWENYTPYEWRTVGALLRLGERNAAATMVAQFMGDRRPINWQQWAEVVWRDARNPKFIGDMPHTWVGSDFIRSALDMLAYGGDCLSDRQNEATNGMYYTAYKADCAMTIGAGIQRSWFVRGDSVVVRGLHTPHGILNYTLTMRDSTVTVRFDNAIPMPSGGIRILLPSTALPFRITSAVVDGTSEPLPPATERIQIASDAVGIAQNPGNEFYLRHQARTVVLTFR